MLITILIVDDDPEMLRAVEDALSGHEFSIYTAVDGQSALTLAHEHEPDLVVLDIDLPRGVTGSRKRLDGVQVLKQLRRVSDVGVLMLTTTDLASMKILALEMGADDYLTKPFDSGELLARVKSILRRKRPSESESDVLTFEKLVIDCGAHKVFLSEREVDLTVIEFDLLLTMAMRPGQAFSRATLFERVWDDVAGGDERLVDTHVSRLRKKIEPDPSMPHYIVTIRGIGYRFESQPA